jgi:hypothetical protein
MAVPIGVPMNALVFWLWLIFLVFESLYSRRFAYGDALEQPIAYAAVRSKLLVIHCILGVLGLALGIASGQFFQRQLHFVFYCSPYLRAS